MSEGLSLFIEGIRALVILVSLGLLPAYCVIFFFKEDE